MGDLLWWMVEGVAPYGAVGVRLERVGVIDCVDVIRNKYVARNKEEVSYYSE